MSNTSICQFELEKNKKSISESVNLSSRASCNIEPFPAWVIITVCLDSLFQQSGCSNTDRVRIFLRKLVKSLFLMHSISGISIWPRGFSFSFLRKSALLTLAHVTLFNHFHSILEAIAFFSQFLVVGLILISSSSEECLQCDSNVNFLKWRTSRHWIKFAEP